MTDDIYIPSCPTCGDPVTSGCYPADGICALADDDGPDDDADFDCPCGNGCWSEPVRPVETIDTGDLL